MCPAFSWCIHWITDSWYYKDNTTVRTHAGFAGTLMQCILPTSIQCICPQSRPQTVYDHIVFSTSFCRPSSLVCYVCIIVYVRSAVFGDGLSYTVSVSHHDGQRSRSCRFNHKEWQRKSKGDQNSQYISSDKIDKKMEQTFKLMAEIDR